MATKRQIQILRILSDRKWMRENMIKSSCNFLREMYFAGWLDGGGYPDKRGVGNYPHTRVWRITDKGMSILKDSEKASHAPRT